jgi:uncharacterized membrane protein YczE
MPDAIMAAMRRRVTQLVTASIVLGGGVAMLLLASLGSDGYSTLINGLSIASSISFVLVNCVVGLLLVWLAWLRGLKPGPGTIVQPLVVGAVVSVLLATVEEPDHLGLRLVLLVLAFPVLACGVAAYLGTGMGAGPIEGAALAFDPPVQFRWSYSTLQGLGALAGWLLGAAIGPGTLLVILLLGPLVDLLSARIPAFNIHSTTHR